MLGVNASIWKLGEATIQFIAEEKNLPISLGLFITKSQIIGHM